MRYYAFGCHIESEVLLPLLSVHESSDEADVRIVRSATPDGEEPEPIVTHHVDGGVSFHVPEVGTFTVSEGKTIRVAPSTRSNDTALALYVLGKCMGVIFQQRNLLAFHGSGICRDGKAIILTGPSGAGKSTLASEFLSRGWSFMSDDLSLLTERDGRFFVRSAYPAQKLWMDAVSRYERDNGTLLPLLRETGRDKYHVSTEDRYFDGELELSAIAVLSAGEGACSFSELFGMQKLSALVENIYLKRALADDEQNGETIRAVVRLAGQIRAFSCTRNNDLDSASFFYRNITEQLLKAQTASEK